MRSVGERQVAAANGRGLEQCVLAVGDGGQMKDRIGLHDAVVTDVFAVRAFGLGMALWVEIALQHVFGVGRHPNVVRYTFDDRYGLAAHRAEHCQLVNVGQRHHGADVVGRVRADHVGHRQRLLARHRLKIDGAQIARRDQVDAGLARPAQHDAAAADIGAARIAELRKIEAGGYIGRTVRAVLQVYRQAAEIRLIVAMHDPLDRRIRRRQLDRRDGIGEALLQHRQKVALFRFERQRQPAPRTHDIAGEFSLLRAGRLEPGGARVAVEHGSDVDKIDRRGMNLALAQLHQLLDKASQPKPLGIDRSHYAPFAGDALTPAGLSPPQPA